MRWSLAFANVWAGSPAAEVSSESAPAGVGFGAGDFCAAVFPAVDWTLAETVAATKTAGPTGQRPPRAGLPEEEVCPFEILPENLLIAGDAVVSAFPALEL